MNDADSPLKEDNGNDEVGGEEKGDNEEGATNGDNQMQSSKY